METAKTSRKKASKNNEALSLPESYKNFLLEQGRAPASIFKFCTDLGIKEEVFYNQFGSFEAIDRFLWKQFISDTIVRLNADSSFLDFTTREKLLTFYFSLAEVLKVNRSYVLLSIKHQSKMEMTPDFLRDYRREFEGFMESILQDGLGKGEIASRPLLDKRYPQLFWVHMSLFLNFWKNDSSKGFESSDVFIEKSVNLAFELIGKGALDAGIDMLKFLYQNKKD